MSAQQPGGVVESAGESLQNFPGFFLWYPTGFGSAQQQAGLLKSQVRAKLPGIFVWRPIEVEDAQQLGGVGKSGESRKKVPGNFLW